MSISNELSFSSSLIKYLNNPYALESYINNKCSAVCAHVSPEGSCNLECSYCQVKKTTNRLELRTIKKFIDSLSRNGLKSVILTGGGEPLLYPEINELIKYIKKNNLKLGIITNGTLFTRLDDISISSFEWIRISINNPILNCVNILNDLKKQLHRIPKTCNIGISYVCGTNIVKLEEKINKILSITNECNIDYVRISTDRFLSVKEMNDIKVKITNVLSNIDKSKIMLTDKLYKAPCSNVCHRSYFKPYLSEIPYDEYTNGSILPCGCVVHGRDNVDIKKYMLCKPDEILKFVNKNICFPFSPNTLCDKCEYSDIIDTLEYLTESNIIHKEFL